MKKTKLIVSTLASFLLAGVMTFSLVACTPEAPGPAPIPPKTDEDVGIESNEDTLALQKIALEGNYPTEFELNAPYSSTNLSVSATYIDTTIEVTEDDPTANVKTVTLETSDYTIDYSEYDASKVGTYTIYVSHTHAGVTRFASYDVSVNEKEPEIGGIVASVVESKGSYTLTADVTSVTVGKDAVTVHRIGDDGQAQTEALTEADYNVQLYLGTQKCTDNTADENGVYSLEVSLASDPTVKDFVLITVANPVSKIELAQSDDAVYTQEESSKDTISETWQFTVTYINGKTKTVKSGDAGLTITLDTRTAGANKKATVSYAETAAGASAPTTVTCEVEYTITAKPVTGDQTYTVTHDVTDISSNTDFADVAAAWTVTWAEGKEDTSEGVVIDYADNLKGKGGNKKTVDQSKSVDGSVTFDSSNTITITVKDNVTVESLVLWISHGSDGTRTATFSGGTIDSVSVAVTKTDKAPLDKIEVSDLGKGTYILTADQEMRIYEIDMTYTVSGGQGGEQGDLSPIGFNFNSITNYDSSGNVDTTVAFSETIDVDASYVNSITIKNRTGQNFGFRQESGTIEDTEYSYTQYLYTRGASQQSRRVVELNLSTDYNYTISVYARVDNAEHTGRYVGMQQNATVPTGNGSDLTQAPNAPELTTTISQTDITIDTANGGIVYIGGTNSIRIYYIVITPVAKV